MFYLGFLGSDKSLCDAAGGVHATLQKHQIIQCTFKGLEIAYKDFGDDDHDLHIVNISYWSKVTKWENFIPSNQPRKKVFYEDSYVGNSVILGLCRQCQCLMFWLCVLLCNPFQLHKVGCKKIGNGYGTWWCLRDGLFD